MNNFHLIIFILLINWKCITSTASEILEAEQKHSIAPEDSIIDHSFSGALKYKPESRRKGKSIRSQVDSSEVYDVVIVKQLECPLSYTEVDGLCLHYKHCRTNWDTLPYDYARVYCQEFDIGGGDLVVFRDANEYRSIVKFLIRNDPNHDCNYWLGAEQPADPNYQFVDETYVPSSGPFWALDEPDTDNPNIVFGKGYSYRLLTFDDDSEAGAICQYKPENITLTQRIYPRRSPHLISVPHPVIIGENKEGVNNVNNLDITLPASNFSSEQNANFKNAPVINIETHSHYIDSSPEIIPIPPYLPLPKLQVHNTHIPNNNYHHLPRPYHHPHPTEGYFPLTVRGHNPSNTNMPQTYINSGQVPGSTENFYNQGIANLVSRDDKNKTEMNKTVAQKFIKESTISPNLKTNRGSLSGIQTGMDSFKQRSRETVQLSKEKDSEDAMAQLTSLLDKIDVKYGKPKGQINTEFASHSKRTISKEEEAARLIKIMNELHALIAKVELSDNALKLDTNQPNQSVKGLKHKNPRIGS